MANLIRDEEVSIQPNELFNDRWKLYQKILSNNYMEHREIYDILQKFLNKYFQNPFSLLELGCGDASFTVKALANTNVAAYQGIDLSENALLIAQANMVSTPYTKKFLQGDISQRVSELVKTQGKSFDAVLTSFAFHHLSLEQKDVAMGKIFNLLNPGGTFIIIDMIRMEQESQQEYIQRYLNNVRQSWQNLTSQEVEMVASHICGEDLPETQTTLSSVAKNHGFTSWKCLYGDSQGLSKILYFEKKSS